MTRRRRELFIALLLALLAAGGGYWLAQRDGPGPILRTTAVGPQPGDYWLNEETSRLDIQSDSDGSPSTVSTRTGALVLPTDAVAQALGGPLVDHRSGHAFTFGHTPGLLLMTDAQGLRLLRSVPVPSHTALLDATLDEPSERLYLGTTEGAVLVTVDARTGDVLDQAPACTTAARPIVDRAGRQIFVPCADGTTFMIDPAGVRPSRVLSTGALGGGIAGLADERTGRVFLYGTTQLAVIDARTGRLVRTLPYAQWRQAKTWPGGVIDLDPRSGNMVFASFAGTGLGVPSSAVLVLDGTTGAVLHHWDVPVNPTSVLVNPLTGHLLVTSAGPLDASGQPLGAGTLSVLNLRDGQIVQHIEVGILPADLQADRGTGHLFLINHATALDGGPLARSYSDGWWRETQRHLKGWAGWLPFTAPVPPPPPTNATVMMLDLTKL